MVAGANGHLRAVRRFHSMPLGTCCHQGTQSHQVVTRPPQGDDPVDQRAAPVAQLPQSADGLRPAKDLLDQLPLSLVDLVARMARGPDIDRAIWGLSRDVRGHLECADLVDEARHVVAFCRPRRCSPAAPLAASIHDAASRSDVPVAAVTQTFATRPWRLSSGTWPRYAGAPRVPGPFDTAAPPGPWSTGACRCADAHR